MAVVISAPAAWAYPLYQGSVATPLFGALTLDKVLWNLGVGQDPGTPSAERFRPQTHAPGNVPTQAEREAKLQSLQLNVPGEVTLNPADRINLAAVPADNNGATIHGLEARWESDNELVVSVSLDGQVLARRPGKATLTVSAGSQQEKVIVSVGKGTSSDAAPPPCDRENVGEAGLKFQRIGQPVKEKNVRFAHSASRVSAAAQEEPPTIPVGEVGSIYEPRNAVGSPPNQARVSASVPPAAIEGGSELPGSDSFKFSLPVVSLPGRGIDVKLNLHYNSRIWNESTYASGIKRLTYDVDKGWPAPGFSLSYGRLERRSNNTYTLLDPDGTRHELRAEATPSYFVTRDGTYIRYFGGVNGGSLYYPDGMIVDVVRPGWTGNYYYPSKITDASGNYILFSYDHQANYRLSSIKDTLGRFVRFHYEGASNKLIAVTEPGYHGTQDRQTIRLYYEEMPLNLTGAFQGVLVTAPASARVIRYVYFPGTGSGYRYDYSQYGMIRQVTQLRDMRVSNVPSSTEMGTITSEGQTAAVTTYNYPAGPANLSAAPTYTRRTDDWAGRTAGMNGTMEAPYFTFANDRTEENVVTTITAPDGTETVSTSEGMEDTVVIRKPQNYRYITYSKSRVEWQSMGIGNRRPKLVQTTNEAGQTKTVEYAYSGYANVSQVTERDFNVDATTLGRPLRRTKTQYATDVSFPNYQKYTDRRLLRLPTRVEVFSVQPNGSEVKMSRVDYGYDETELEGRPNAANDPLRIGMHDPRYDPYAPFIEQCETPPCCPDCEPVCTMVPQYQQQNKWRGNLTSVKAYSEAIAGAVGTNKTFRYDIAGNVVSEGAVSCCQQRAFAYDPAYQYAYPTAETRGSGPQQTTRYSYDYHTGVLRTSTDENDQTTTHHYYPETLRPYMTVKPDGGTTETIYFNDMLFAAPDASRMNSAVMTIKSLDSTRSVRSWLFFDGRGNATRAFGDNAGQGHVGARDSEYDEMNRLRRVSNPFYAVTGGQTPVNPTGKWTTLKYDPLGRAIHVTLPDGNAAQNTNVMLVQHAGSVITYTDMAGRKRRQTLDAIDRLIQVDESDDTGALNQTTTYTYDALDNLSKVTQGEQTRFFKYDSLSRLTHERHVEQDTPHQQTDTLTGNQWWSRKTAYNEYGLVIDSWDARGVHTHRTYDGLNRLKQITYAGDPHNTTPTATYTYDEVRPGYFNHGKLTTITTAEVGGTQTPAPPTSQVYDYDRMGRIKRQRQSVSTNTYTLSYDYNLAGLMTSQTYPSGRVVNQSYDDAARLQSIADGAGRVYTGNFSYSAHGGVESETWGNSAVHSIAYNDRLQISQIRLAAGGVERQRYDYSYGQINVDTAALDTNRNTGQVASIDGWVDGVKQWQQRFAYDKLGRLSTAKEVTNDVNGSQAWRLDYTYDRYGNRLQAAGQGNVPVAANEIDGNRNRFLSPYYDPNNSTSPLVVYDAAGNITIDRKFNERQYTYDANGRMRRSDAAYQYAIATYDGVGQRVQHNEFGITRQRVYDAFGQLVADYENNILKRDYVYRNNSLLCTIEADASERYVLADHLGSTRAVMSGGQVVGRTDYLPFGEDIAAYTGLRTPAQGYGYANPLRQGYASMERDMSTGLYHTLFRKYETRSGRWTTPDPYDGSVVLLVPQSINRYPYVQSDPVNLVDPTGLFSIGPGGDKWVKIKTLVDDTIDKECLKRQRAACDKDREGCRAKAAGTFAVATAACAALLFTPWPYLAVLCEIAAGINDLANQKACDTARDACYLRAVDTCKKK
jgi:RHS repeat-associated protein